MGWYVSGTFNITTEEEDTDTDKPTPQECVGKYQNGDILISPSTNMEHRRRWGVNSCLVGTRNEANKIGHCP